MGKTKMICCCCLSSFIYFLGVLGLLRATWELFLAAQQVFLFSKTDVVERYKKGTYVVITGSTNGIGLEFAKYFASQGMNLVCISRNASLLAQREKEIKQLYPGVKIVNITKDFKQSYKVEFYKEIEEKTKDLDVGLLINNVGMFFGFRNEGQFGFGEQEYKDIIAVNMHSLVGMTQLFMPRLLKRGTPGAVVTLSSIASHINVAPYAIYSVSKMYTSYICQGLYMRQFKPSEPEIDFLNISPGIVTTNMTNGVPGSKFSSNEISANVPPQSFALLGQQLNIWGSRKMALAYSPQGWFIYSVPREVHTLLTGICSFLTTVAPPGPNAI